TPNTDYTGPDSFTYKTTDSLLTSNTATVNVTVNEVNTDEIVNAVINHSFNYFWNETDNPETGFTRDRLLANGDPTTDPHYEKASMAATGFGLAALCVAAEKYGDGTDPDWQVSPEQLAARAELILDKLLFIQSSQAAAGDATWGKSGFFYHFTNIITGEAWPNTEVSTIDTAILVAGALTAGEYFKDMAPNINIKARQVYANVDWNSFVDYTPGGHYGQFHKQWVPGGAAFNDGHWDYSDEAVLLYLLAIGSPVPEHAISPDLYYSFRRAIGNYGVDGKPIVHNWFGSLFAYQYMNAFFDLRDMHDARNVDWWQNAVDATIANRQFCIDQDNIGGYGYNDNVWGISSAYAVGANYIGDYGAPPTGSPTGPTHDGTVNPSVVASAIGMLPDEVSAALAFMKSDSNIWRQDSYGFIDSFKNSEPRVYSDYYVGLDLGASLVMSANHTNNGLIWNNFMNAQTRDGQIMWDVLAQLNFRPNSDPALHLDMDDITPKSQFAYGLVSQDNTNAQIVFNLADVVPDSQYMLAIHTLMNNYAGNYQVSVNVNVNGNDMGDQVFAHMTNQQDEIKYIEIDSSFLNQGENMITMTWISGNNWVAWTNAEVSAPVIDNTWTIVRSVEGNEYRLDDTYYTAHANKYGVTAYKTFEQAINSATDPYTDILFYIDDVNHDRVLTLKSYDSDGGVSINIGVNGQPSSQDVVLGGQQEQQFIISANRLKEGWNRIRLLATKQAGEWIIWDNLKLELGDPVRIESPQSLAAASFGSDKTNLRWNSVRGVNVRYNLYRSPSSSGPYAKVNSSAISSTQYQDTGLQDDTFYYYVVTAFEEADPAVESPYSGEVFVKTGSYDVDYGDGKDPNAFGGSSSSNYIYILDSRHDWTVGQIRKLTLTTGSTGYISLNGANVSQAASISLWIKGSGGEKIRIGLRDGSSNQSEASVTVAAGWQNLILRLSDFSGVSMSNLDRLYFVSESASQINIYMDSISFVKEAASSYSLSSVAKNVSDNGRSTGLSFSPGPAYAPAGQYIEIKYGISANNWKIWVYTKNDNGDPAYMNGNFNGLMRSDGRSRIPLIYRLYPTIQAGGVPCSTEADVYTGGNMTWNYIKDKNDSDWATANAPGQEYSVICYGGDTWAHLANVPPSAGTRDPVNSTFLVYIGGEFKTVGAGDYSTTIYFDLTHE
ncbi:MAG: glucoamylase family protein, partial [Candidatus Omnitrophota bacterium]